VEIGDELDGRYRIVGTLGEGGMGEVFLAEHIALHRREALKILRPDLSTDEDIGRFRREARVTNRLQHPNIIAVYDFGRLPDGRFYLATEYAEGESIAEHLMSSGAFEPHRVVRILEQLADAMAHAHERGVVHRDLKPDNLMLVRERSHTDVLKVLDFGIAKINAPDFEDSVKKTGRAVFYGTPEYVAPERITLAVDAPSVDIYSVGCIGYEMLTGDPPFQGRPMEILHHHVKTPAPTPSALAPNAVPAELDAIILRCMQKRPEDRYPSAEALRAALRELPFESQRPSQKIPLPVRPPSSSDSSTQRPTPNVAPVALGKGKATEEESTEIPTTEKPSDAPWYADDLPVSPEVLDDLYRASVSLGEAIVDAGCSDVGLIVSLAAVASAEDDLMNLIAQLDELEGRTRDAEQRLRKRESSIRFALGELLFERAQAKKRGENTKVLLVSEIEVLEKRLAKIAEQSKEEIARLQDEAIRLAALRDDLEVQRAQAHRPLRRQALRLASDYASDPEIDALWKMLKDTVEKAGNPL